MRLRPRAIPGRAALVLLPGLACAVVGSVLLGRKSLWLDESVSATLAQLGWRDLARVLVGRETNMALYHLALKGWTGAFGVGEVAVRSFSVLCAAVAACAVTALAGRLLGRAVGLLSGLLFGLDPVVLAFAQTARGYALCLLLVVVAELLLVDALRRHSRRAWIGYAAVTACAVATNALAVLLPVANLLALVALPGSLVRRRDLAGSAVPPLLLVAPLLLRVHQVNAGGVDWIAGAAGGRLVQRIDRLVPAPVSLSLLAVAVATVLAVVVRRRRPTTLWSPWSARVLLLSWLVTPPVGVLALSLAYRPLLVPRYLVFCLPPLVVLVAAALLRPRHHAAVAAGVTLALLLSLALDVGWYRAGPREDWRAAVAEVTARAGASDGILFYPADSRVPFDYYRARTPGAAVLEPVDPERAGGVRGELAALGPIPIGRSSVAAAARRSSRLWLVVRRDRAGPSAGEQEVRSGLTDAGLAALGGRCLRQVCVAQYRRPGGPGP
ncbi:MAG TPA: glycosyltransferase family 39 protein [Actinomycetes bacterium]